jgi:hypothetical protein
MSKLTDEQKASPLIQILAYCKPEGEDSSDFDLTFASDLAAMIDPNAAAASSSPAAVKLSIEAATGTMTALIQYERRARLRAKRAQRRRRKSAPLRAKRAQRRRRKSARLRAKWAPNKARTQARSLRSRAQRGC